MTLALTGFLRGDEGRCAALSLRAFVDYRGVAEKWRGGEASEGSFERL
jgi:hypothetical protein